MTTNRQELLAHDAERYAVERLRVAHLNYPPRWVTIGVSSMCTNHCTFCSYHSLDARGSSNVYGLKYVMPLPRFKSQVDFFHAGRVPHVHICGTGEPFLHPDIMAMIDHVIERYGDTSFQSTFNRSVMTRGDYLPKILERRAHISYIVTDIHAGDAAGHDAIKRGSSFADLLTTLQILSDAGIRIICSFILARENHASLPGLIKTLHEHGIRLRLNVDNLFPHMFNEFTAMENVYHLGNRDIEASLQKARELAEATGGSIELELPSPFGDPSARCSVFWDKIQIWPVKGADPARYDENLVPHACNAVVRGDLNSLGYVSDYPNVMALWNNPILVALREKILAGEAPDRFCWSCPCGTAFRSLEHVVSKNNGSVALDNRQRLSYQETDSTTNRPRLIAFHLPQFHTIPENDEWWGKGFTEWTNVAKTTPSFPDHYQPHVPEDLGYYDLSDPDSLKAQVALAKEYGIHGFCFYHYWFNGKLLLETPLHQMLKSGEPDFPFCLCWANEDWTRAWDGRSGEKLMEQHYNDADDIRHLHYLANFFEDKRYIRINGKPLFLVYRANQMPDPLHTTTTWREVARKLGHDEIYLCRVESFWDEHTNPIELGFDASIEFQPDWAELVTVKQLEIAEAADNSVFNYANVVRQMIGKQEPDYKRFPGVFPSWDNSPRRKTKALVIHDSSPLVYKNWLKESIRKVQHNSADEQLVFINAWNEWGEGNHLEPDVKFGRGYLEATKAALSEIAHETYRFCVSIIIPVHNEVSILYHCLESIKLTVLDVAYEIIVVDNASTDGTGPYLGTLDTESISVITNSVNYGFDFACKQAAEIAQGEHLVFLNCSPEMPRGWMDYLLKMLAEDCTLAAITDPIGMVFDANNGGCDCLIIRHDIFNQASTDIIITEVFKDFIASGITDHVNKLGFNLKYSVPYKDIIYKFDQDAYQQVDEDRWLGPDAIFTVPGFLLRRPLTITFYLYLQRISVFENEMQVVKIYVDETIDQVFVFTSDDEKIFVKLEIPHNCNDVKIRIESKAYFVPDTLGESDDYRKLSILIHKLKYHP